MPTFRFTLPLSLSVGLMALSGPALGAQAVHGRLIEVKSEAPVPDAEISLVRDGGFVVEPVRTDSAGRFRISTTTAGFYQVRVRRLGFKPTETPSFWLATGADHEAELRLVPVPRKLDMVRVVAYGLPGLDWTDGFEARRLRNQGAFKDRSEIVRTNPTLATEALRGMPGIEIVPGSTGGGTRWLVVSSRGRNSIRADSGGAGLGARALPAIRENFPDLDRTQQANGCPSDVYVDGINVDDVDAVMRADEISAIEVYAGPAGVPPRFRDHGCGVVLIWTRSKASDRSETGSGSARPPR